METAQLYQGLTFLAYTTGIIVVLVGVMLVKVLYDISHLTRNIDETTTIVKTELEPTLKNINKSVEIVSGIIIKADEGAKKVKQFLSIFLLYVPCISSLYSCLISSNPLIYDFLLKNLLQL